MIKTHTKDFTIRKSPKQMISPSSKSKENMSMTMSGFGKADNILIDSK
jgi:hypothetical protein